jgi:CMP-N,N'-diacetyllegionaminic acid synthase
VPARSGSLRVPDKNIRRLDGHPLIAYAIAAAKESGVFKHVVVSTDSELIARIAVHYGAEVPGLRPAELATSTSPDIAWIEHVFGALSERPDAFAIIRPTSPFRGGPSIARGFHRFVELSHTHGIDSLRAVELCKQHPGKMWVIEGETMRPLLDQSHLEVAWHAQQYQSLPPVYVQNSSLEIAWSRVVTETGSREGRVVAPFELPPPEGLAIDNPEDWDQAERLVATGQALLPAVRVPAWTPDKAVA